jgi:hypothetical protein
MTFAAALQGIRDGRAATTVAATEVISQDIAARTESQQKKMRAHTKTDLRLNVLEQNLQLYGRSPESTWKPEVSFSFLSRGRAVGSGETGGKGGLDIR